VALDKLNSPQIGSSINAWLPFLFYCVLSVTLMLVDNRFSISSVIRNQASVLVSPAWWLASRPYALWQNASMAISSNQQLRSRVDALEVKQLKSDIALQQVAALQNENDALRGLLHAQQRLALNARMVELVSINPDPALKRYVIDKGASHKVRIGQVLMDAHGLVGQVSEVYAGTSLVIGITDADHALPVMVARSGFRSILFGQGNDRQLSLANLTPSDDVKVGDILLTSGIGGRFPPGIPVGRVKKFKQDEALAFLSAQVRPFARMAYGRQFLLLEEVIGEPARPLVPMPAASISGQSVAAPASEVATAAQAPAGQTAPSDVSATPAPVKPDSAAQSTVNDPEPKP
jgi:rod shape-determining protein MreC